MGEVIKKYKYDLKNRLQHLTSIEFKRARKELPAITGYNWKTIWYQWCEIQLHDKRSIPSEPLDKIANWLKVNPNDIKNYDVPSSSN